MIPPRLRLKRRWSGATAALGRPLSAGLVLALTGLACGGTGTEADRAVNAANKAAEEAAAASTTTQDPGSGPVFCETAKTLEFMVLDDFEFGAAGLPWYVNSDICDDCDDIEKSIKELTDKHVSDTDPDLKALRDSLDACKAPCMATLSPSKWSKPLPAERIKGNPPCGSRYAMHVRGGPFNAWGGNLGVNFAAPIDGRGWQGIAFWARVAPGSRAVLRAELSDKYSNGDYDKEPGFPYCASKYTADTRVTGCDTFGSRVVLDQTWQLLLIPFSEMRQGGWGRRAPELDTSALLSMSFMYQTGAWDIWIDDPALYRLRTP